MADGHVIYASPHATSNAAAARFPRRRSARVASSKHTRDATRTVREYARGQALDWDSLHPARQVAMLKGGAKPSDFAAWRRDAAALG